MKRAFMKRVANSCGKSVMMLCSLQISGGCVPSSESRRTETVASESCRPRVRLTSVYCAEMDQGWQDPGNQGGKRSTSAPVRDRATRGENGWASDHPLRAG